MRKKEMEGGDEIRWEGETTRWDMKKREEVRKEGKKQVQICHSVSEHLSHLMLIYTEYVVQYIHSDNEEAQTWSHPSTLPQTLDKLWSTHRCKTWLKKNSPERTDGKFKKKSPCPLQHKLKWSYESSDCRRRRNTKPKAQQLLLRKLFSEPTVGSSAIQGERKNKKETHAEWVGGPPLIINLFWLQMSICPKMLTAVHGQKYVDAQTHKQVIGLGS